jgi:hypothetical protein
VSSAFRFGNEVDDAAALCEIPEAGVFPIETVAELEASAGCIATDRSFSVATTTAPGFVSTTTERGAFSSRVRTERSPTASASTTPVPGMCSSTRWLSVETG